jgi:flavin-dependent thymidylate synthase
MKVTLLDYTGAGNLDPARYAANILVYTRSTRLKMSPGLLDEIKMKSYVEIMEELRQMADTLPSSWEFIHFTFLIEEVTRAFTHQLVRTRTASYAQQAMRIVPMEGFTYEIGPSIAKDEDLSSIYNATMGATNASYQMLLKRGAKTEDARGILPTNIHTNINMSINMRNFINMARKRASIRVQDEYKSVVDAMLIEIQRVYPWFHIFYKNDEVQGMRDLQDMINDNKKLSEEEKMAMFKKIDLLRTEK